MIAYTEMMQKVVEKLEESLGRNKGGIPSRGKENPRDKGKLWTRKEAREEEGSRR